MGVLKFQSVSMVEQPSILRSESDIRIKQASNQNVLHTEEATIEKQNIDDASR